MFDLDQLVADCRAAIAQDSSQKSVREVVSRAISDPAAVLKGIGEPKRAAIQPLYRSHDLTILNVVWPASFTRTPHNHQMWAVIGSTLDGKTTYSGVACQARTVKLKQRVLEQYVQRMPIRLAPISFIPSQTRCHG